MTVTRRLIILIGLLAVVVAWDSNGSESAARPGGETAEPECPDEGGEFADTKLYIEHNATDEDTGVHALFAAEGWTQLCVFDPDGNLLIVADPQSQLGDLGLADLFWESREPENVDYSIDDLKADFPEGEYRVSGVDFEGNPLAGTALFTHDIPAPPTITAPAGLTEDAETAGETILDPPGIVVEWEPVTETIDGDPVTVTAYEVIVTDDAFEDPHGFAQPIYDVHVGPGVTSLSVPPEFFTPDTVYEIEVLVLEESGNQTISLGFFQTP
jgi:hypothetical protein